MTTKRSESMVRRSLNEVDLSALVVYKPPDLPFAANVRPCDYMAWWADGDERGLREFVGCAWIEVKETPNMATFPLSLLRKGQIKGMRDALAMGLLFLVVTYWPRHGNAWSITTGERILRALDANPRPTSLRWEDMIAGGGIDVKSGQRLAPTLRLAMLGEL
jgi:hypothetical protein